MRTILTGLLILMAVSASAQMIGNRTVASAPTSEQSATLGTLSAAGGTASHWFPTKSSSVLAKEYWDQAQDNSIQALKAAQFVSSKGGVAAATEAVSDFAAGGRVALSTAVASPTDSAKATAAGDTTDPSRATNLFLANGGNLALTYEYPVFLVTNSAAAFRAHAYWRTATNITGFGEHPATNASNSNDVSKTNAMTELGGFAIGHFRTASDKFEFESLIKTSFVTGTKPFQTSLEASHRSFAHFEVGGGIRIVNVVTLAVTWNRYTSKALPNQGAVLTVAIGR
jgi:hypothetical protein